MKIKMICIAIIGLLFLSNFIVFPVSSKEINANSEGTIIYVNHNYPSESADGSLEHPFKTISHAIESANYNGKDTVYVFNGAYKENVTINKSIKLIGESKEDTIILGERTVTTDGVHLIAKQREFIINITADNVEVSNLNILGYNEELNYNGPLDETINAIKINSCSHVKLSNIAVGFASNCIKVIDSSDISIINSLISSSEKGVNINNSSNVNISGNSFFQNIFSIHAIDLIDSTISKNNFLLSLRNVYYKISINNLKNRTVFSENYWTISRVFIKSISAFITFNNFEIPWIFFDKKPSFNKYSI